MKKKILKSPKKAKIVQDIPFDITPEIVDEASMVEDNYIPSNLEPTKATSTLVEETEIMDWTTAINNLCRRYMIADQTEIVIHALGELPSYKIENIKNCTDVKIDNINKWYLIANDFATHLDKYEELILTNKEGTWWGTRLDEAHPFALNKTLIAIVMDAEKIKINQEEVVKEVSVSKS